MEKKYCPKCHSEISSNDVFCGVCGQKIESAQNQKKSYKEKKKGTTIFIAVLCVVIVSCGAILIAQNFAFDGNDKITAVDNKDQQDSQQGNSAEENAGDTKDSNAEIINDGVKSEEKTTDYGKWETADTETIFNDAVIVIRNVLLSQEYFDEVRVFGDENIDISKPYAIGLQIDDVWDYESGYTMYISCEKEAITVQVVSTISNSLCEWQYGWDGTMLSGNKPLEEFMWEIYNPW